MFGNWTESKKEDIGVQKKMKVCDYKLDYNGGGVFTCCEDDIVNNDSETKLGDIIECDECKAKMILERCFDGVIRWRGIKR